MKRETDKLQAVGKAVKGFLAGQKKRINPPPEEFCQTKRKANAVCLSCVSYQDGTCPGSALAEADAVDRCSMCHDLATTRKEAVSETA